MKLYYSKGACSMAVHIAVEELGLQVELQSVNLLESPPDYLNVNPLGQVPTLQLDNGELLTQVAVILQFLADSRPESGLIPKPGTWERVRLQEWLNFIATEIHKGFGPLWALEGFSSTPQGQEEVRKFTVSDLGRKFEIVSKKLGDQTYLMPQGYTVADAYLFTLLNWTGFLKMDLKPWPKLVAYMDRVRARPAVQRTLKAEHLI